ncbi:MAG TPA: maleylpyruvate isomerase family mycothiol-dependent enzyme [Nocardioides sp.]|nr:maleylpyruvate isomerase family mycothiol-dependent enzyme [Nocardioides sp.]
MAENRGGTPRSRTPGTLEYGGWMRAAEEEYRRIDVLLAGLDDEQWQRPTDCDGWQVRDVVAHLAGAAAGTASVPELLRQAWHGRRRGGDGDLVDRMNAVQVAERQHLSPAELRADLAESSRRGLRARRRLPAPARAVRLPFGPPLGIRPLGYLMGRIYTRDAWMHRVDLARATGVPLTLTPDHDGVLVEDLVAEWATTHDEPFLLEVTGPAGGSFRRGNTTSLTVDAVDLARTLSGRATGAGLLAHTVPF